MSENRNQQPDSREVRSERGEELQNNGSESRGSGTSRRGFAAMDPERQRQIARQGGKAAHQQGVAHQWTTEEARAAGRKGGQNSRGGGRKSEQ